ncbi:polyprenyl synthetase family protein [Thermocrinis minervae]|uniref:Octaprenyl-diphosphate synthase n=1 Tax=Thermocrinis minervae TaxID=381751 RepID=A0A1M6TE11_9AQUI|nr:polyprenyl synthetase family protein [Thermocrinis minervae]SHK55203.1 octaprenyl-diphosphate synthase [Thermocrinis minervae]
MITIRDLDRALLEYLGADVEDVANVAQYIISAGGKRIRPTFFFLITQMLEGDQEKVLPLCVGIEYIHVASLLHDDVVDGAQTRRGKKSANLVFGNGVSVLGGDYMYARALWLYSKFGNMESIRILSQAVMDMSQAQVLELKSIGKLIDEETYFRIIDGKTASLFGATFSIASLMAGREDYEDFYQVGMAVGRAFQLMDDALDYVGSEDKLGKPVANDLREGKCTYPLISILGFLDVKSVQEAFMSKDVEWLRKKVIELGGVEKTKERARQEIEKALNFFRNFENSEEVVKLIITVVERDF